MQGDQIIGKKNLSTIECQSESHPRVQKKNEHPLGTRYIETQKAQREETPDSLGMRKLTFSRSEKLRKPSDFHRVYSSGRRIVSSSFVLIFCSNASEVTRFGFSVSKRIGNAVVRNRTKRLAREAFRLNKCKLKKGYDILLVARKGVEELKFRQVEALVLDLCHRGGLLV